MEPEQIQSKDNQNYDLQTIKLLVPEWISAYNDAQERIKTDKDDEAVYTIFEKSTPLHLAVQCASLEIIQYLISCKDPSIPLNVKDPLGNTELHYAVKASQKEVVAALLEAGSDEDIPDSNGQTASMIAPNIEIENIIYDHRNAKIGEATTLLFSLALKDDTIEINSLLKTPGFENKINLLARNTSDGKTLLHIAAEKNNIELAKWIINHGISLFTSDFNNKLAYSYSKSPEMLDLISKASTARKFDFDSDTPPKCSGMLDKWTNYAVGWKARWFELESGVLSYYKNKDDAENSCRGAINLKIARVVLGLKDKKQFDIIGKGSVKYQLRAKTLSEAKQWVHILNLSKQWAIEKFKTNSDAIPGSHDPLSNPISSEPHSLKQYTTEIASKSTFSASNLPRKSSDFTGYKKPSFNGKSLSVHPSSEIDQSFKKNSIHFVLDDLSIQMEPPSPNINRNCLNLNSGFENINKAGSVSAGSSYSDIDSINENTDNSNDFFSSTSIAENHIRTLQIISRELFSLNEEESNWKIAKDYSSNIIDTLLSLESKISEMKSLFDGNNKTWKSKLSNELKRIDTLTETLQSAVLDTQKVGQELLSKVSRSSLSNNNNESKPEAVGAPTSPKDTSFEDSHSDDDDDEDEFADAFDSLLDFDDPNKFYEPPVPDNLVDKPEIEQLKESCSTKDEQKYILEGYDPNGNMRMTLPGGNNKKPAFSLWAIIKNAIGKDLSKISVPVFFNEPSSFLQRFTEDMEYSDLLELACRLPQSADRTMLVASFAMSNYSSTFGRIAKPFNPLLGETYEYVRGDKFYRVFSEQVVHHPPISAMWVEALNYKFHADTAMKSRFTGKSMDITPDCVCHVYLRVPIEYLDKGPDSNLGPRLKQPVIEENNTHFIEHYSWRKLATSVNGIITGSFWIEHYGDLEVTNHSTGDKTVLTFKKSGWLGDNKYKVEGFSKDRKGKTKHLISGNWVSQIIAKPVTSSSDNTFDINDKNGDKFDQSLVSSPAFVSNPRKIFDKTPNDNSSGTSQADISSNQCNLSIEPITLPTNPFVLWKKNESKIKETVYNFTEFAVTLNEIDDNLSKYIAPTDSRFRPDQRAMEIQEFDLADTEKTRLEEKQRAVRKLRESGELEAWKPRWFVQDTDPDTGTKFWKFTGEYWTERERVATEIDEGKTDVKWNNVSDIF
ncbi:Oxysterol-binding protein-like protein [Smittium culicis]|uniref:Oxysterol-binding protein-like protein n=1 Tax=Smittium culicis TaxID=133412 RepID=A0A1R1YDM0_9FUNG|nr:Oxysterol-binding protein-like protein [Smittium culicis]